MKILFLAIVIVAAALFLAPSIIKAGAGVRNLLGDFLDPGEK